MSGRCTIGTKEEAWEGARLTTLELGKQGDGLLDGRGHLLGNIRSQLLCITSPTAAGAVAGPSGLLSS